MRSRKTFFPAFGALGRSRLAGFSFIIFAPEIAVAISVATTSVINAACHGRHSERVVEYRIDKVANPDADEVTACSAQARCKQCKEYVFKDDFRSRVTERA